MVENEKKSLNLTVEEARKRLGRKYVRINRHPGMRIFVEDISGDGSLACQFADGDPDHEGWGYFHVDIKEITEIGYL
jgi:hypothetical protein